MPGHEFDAGEDVLYSGTLLQRLRSHALQEYMRWECSHKYIVSQQATRGE